MIAAGTATIIIIMRDREGNKIQEKQVVLNTTAHHPPSDTQPVPEQQSVAPRQFP